MYIEEKIGTPVSVSLDSDVQEDDMMRINNMGSITKPFNPNDIDVDIATVNLGSLIEQLEKGEIDLQPTFKLATNVWDNVEKSRLIESIILKIPLPSFYLSESSISHKLFVIRGLQCICALNDFVLNKENPLRLEGLQFLQALEGKTYSQLTRPDVNRIKSLKITINKLRKGIPNDVRYIIFQRINTAEECLTSQEMRHILNQGVASDFLKELAEMESFKKATNNSIKSKRMEDREYANLFVAFFNAYKGYTGEMDVFMNDEMGELNKMNPFQIENIRTAFDKSMTCCYQIFEDDTFRKRKDIKDKKKPISKAVYDTLSVNIAWLTDEERKILVDDAQTFRKKMMDLFNDEKFNHAISTATGEKQNVEIRFTRVKNLIKEIINDYKSKHK